MGEEYKSSTDYLLVNLENNILTITLNRPEALNAYRPEMLIEIREIILKTEDDPNVAVIVIEGAGKAFSAGVDFTILSCSRRYFDTTLDARYVLKTLAVSPLTILE